MVDVLTDEEWKTIGIDADGRLVPFAEDQVERLVASLALYRPPRLFTLCGVRRDEDGAARDVSVLGWGIAMGDDDDEADEDTHTTLCYLAPRSADQSPRFGLFASAEGARAMYARRGGDVRVFWHD